MDIDALTRRQRRLSLLAVNMNVLGVGIALGALVPLMALGLARRGVDTTLIGLNAAMFPIAILCVGPFVPRLIARLGTARSVYVGLTVTAVSVLLLPVLTGLPGWFALRFVAGAASCIQWVVTETWLNMIATERDRGRIMGMYAAVIAGGFALGPLIISSLGVEGWLPFLAVALAIVLSAAPLPFARGLIPAMPARHETRIWIMMRAQPLVMICGLGGGLLDFALFALLPIYGLHQGLDESAAVLVLTLFIGGNVLLQFPIGWLADHSSRPGMLVACALLVLAGALLLPLVIDTPWLRGGMVFVWGGASFGIYTLALGLLGDGFPRAHLAAANVALIMAYEVGSAGGPTLAGSAMDLFGPQGLVIAVAAGALLLLPALAFFRPKPVLAEQ
jgi:MFS family permease